MASMTLTLGFLVVALAAYTLFGGADFGGGLLEATLRRHPDLRRRLEATLAPVWEANHVWLIAVIVILFVGFPSVYAALCTHLFLPLSLALLGIVCRGAFFTFRKYDPEPKKRRAGYSLLFRLGSIFTPMMFGFIVAALLSPLPVIPKDGSTDFHSLFIAPWLTWLGALCALFVNFLFGYLAAVFFYGEVDSERERHVVAARIRWLFAGTFLTGGGVLAFGNIHGIVDLKEALTPLQIAAQVVAFLCVIWLWWAMRKSWKWGMRFAAGAQVLAILSGWFSTQYPVFLSFSDGTRLTVQDATAHDASRLWLNIGLIAVLVPVILMMGYLYRVFDTAHTNPQS